MDEVELRFNLEAARTQELSIPAVQATALTYGATYRVSARLAETLLAQGGWEPVGQPAVEPPSAEPQMRKSKRGKADTPDTESQAEE